MAGTRKWLRHAGNGSDSLAKDTSATSTPRRGEERGEERREERGEEAVVPDDPFAVLGLPVRRDLTDEDVRAAWRRIAAATHPDLANGGDPARYSAAAAAYDTLRTALGRGEALADLGLVSPRGSSRAPGTACIAATAEGKRRRRGPRCLARSGTVAGECSLARS